MKFTCTVCAKYFRIERALNTHMLFQHQILKPECKNWDLIDQHNLKIQRMTQRAKDLIRPLERNLKHVPENRLHHAIDWTIIRKDLGELFDILNELLKMNEPIPKISWRLSKVLMFWEREQ